MIEYVLRLRLGNFLLMRAREEKREGATASNGEHLVPYERKLSHIRNYLRDWNLGGIVQC